MKITFTLTDSIGADGLFSDPPSPAKTFVPDWFKSMPTTIDAKKQYGLSLNNNFSSNATVKGCSPFLDALTSGYMYCLPLDVEVRKLNEREYSFRWRSNSDFVSLHDEPQHPGLPSPAELDDSKVLKWACPFTITTPPGYSCLITHPLNRHELPFRTFSGVVDTDSYGLPVQFPFQMVAKPSDILIIERGTPVCQIIPFKRESWTHTINKEDPAVTNEKRFNYKSKIVKAYKSRYWSKKSYE